MDSLTFCQDILISYHKPCLLLSPQERNGCLAKKQNLMANIVLTTFTILVFRASYLVVHDQTSINCTILSIFTRARKRAG